MDLVRIRHCPRDPCSGDTNDCASGWPNELWAARRRRQMWLLGMMTRMVVVVVQLEEHKELPAGNEALSSPNWNLADQET